MVTLLVLGTFLLAIFDALIIAAFVVSLIKKLFGETPLSRLFRMLGRIGSCVLYGYWAIYKTAEYWASTGDFSPVGMIVALALPIVLIAAIYIMNGSGNDSGGSQ